MHTNIHLCRVRNMKCPQADAKQNERVKLMRDMDHVMFPLAPGALTMTSTYYRLCGGYLGLYRHLNTSPGHCEACSLQKYVQNGPNFV